MAYGDVATGEMPLETVIDPLSDEFQHDWQTAKEEGGRLFGPLAQMISQVADLELECVIKADIEHSAWDAFAKTDMRGRGHAWNFYVKDGAVLLSKPFIAKGEKIRINSTVHWQLDDCGEYGKFLMGTIGDFEVAAMEREE